MVENPSISQVQALFFDVFGTLMDWRTSVARESRLILEPLGYNLDWIAFADAWRNEYQPGMEEVRSGKIPFSKLDVLHRRNLERFLPRFNVTGLPEETMRDLNLAWHRLDAWPEVPAALALFLVRKSPATSSRSRASISPPARRSILSRRNA